MVSKTCIGFVLIIALFGCSKDDPDSSAKQPQTTPSQTETATKPAAQIDHKLAKAVNPKDREFAFKSAKITFVNTGMIEGTVIAWVDNHGETVVLERDMTKPMPQKQTIIWKDGKNTMWEHGGGTSKTVQITRLRSRDTELRLISTMDPKQLKYAGYNKLPNETVAGKDCEVFRSERQNVTIWRWQGVDLKVINGAVKSALHSYEATSVETDIALPPTLFQLPADYEVRDMTKRRGRSKN